MMDQSSKPIIILTVVPVPGFFGGTEYTIHETRIKAPGEKFFPVRYEEKPGYLVVETPQEAAEHAIRIARMNNKPESPNSRILWLAADPLQPSRRVLEIEDRARLIGSTSSILVIVCTPTMVIHVAQYGLEGWAFRWANRWSKFAPGSWILIRGNTDDEYWQFGDGSWVCLSRHLVTFEYLYSHK